MCICIFVRCNRGQEIEKERSKPCYYRFYGYCYTILILISAGVGMTVSLETVASSAARPKRQPWDGGDSAVFSVSGQRLKIGFPHEFRAFLTLALKH